MPYRDDDGGFDPILLFPIMILVIVLLAIFFPGETL